jgi:hypothetical protein
MNAVDEGQDRPGDPEKGGAEDESGERQWTPPTRSDQAPGEESVQINDPYVGDDAAPEEETSQGHDQHQTGG